MRLDKARLHTWSTGAVWSVPLPAGKPPAFALREKPHCAAWSAFAQAGAGWRGPPRGQPHREWVCALQWYRCGWAQRDARRVPIRYAKSSYVECHDAKCRYDGLRARQLQPEISAATSRPELPGRRARRPLQELPARPRGLRSCTWGGVRTIESFSSVRRSAFSSECLCGCEVV